MKNSSVNSYNSRFAKVQEELKRFLSIIIYSSTEEQEIEELGLDYYIFNGSDEDAKIAELLKQDTNKRDEQLKNNTYLTEGITKESKKTTKSAKTITLNSQKSNSHNKAPLNPDNTKNIMYMKNRDGYDIEH